MKGVDLIIVGCEDGDWEGVYVDGKLYAEGHSFSHMMWISLIKHYKKFSGDFKSYEFTTEQMDELGNSFPHLIDQIPKEFFK